MFSGVSTLQVYMRQQTQVEQIPQSPAPSPLHTQRRKEAAGVGVVMASAQRRGSATTQGLAVGLLVLCLLLLGADVASAATYSVDWSFAADSWSRGRNFRAGDVLMFSYNRSVHNVVAVDVGGYNGCGGSGKAYSSGNDRVTLRAGKNYFICSLNGHCGMGMKMAVTAN